MARCAAVPFGSAVTAEGRLRVVCLLSYSSNGAYGGTAHRTDSMAQWLAHATFSAPTHTHHVHCTVRASVLRCSTGHCIALHCIGTAVQVGRHPCAAKAHKQPPVAAQVAARGVKPGTLSVTSCPLPVASCLLPVASCLLHLACCLLHLLCCIFSVVSQVAVSPRRKRTAPSRRTAFTDTGSGSRFRSTWVV